jgi:hypothetical protein
MLLYVVCTAGEFVWNKGGVVPATCVLYHDVWFFKILLLYTLTPNPEWWNDYSYPSIFVKGLIEQIKETLFILGEARIRNGLESVNIFPNLADFNFSMHWGSTQTSQQLSASFLTQWQEISIFI